MLPWVEVTPATSRLAIQAQGELARVGHHRVPPADLVMSEWVAPAGSI